MTFDPFGDFETQGYLRNLTKEKDPEIVRHLEHASFMTGIDAALEHLAKSRHFSYSDLRETHRILFEAVYPWAGQDRHKTAPDLAISRGPALFAHPNLRMAESNPSPARLQVATGGIGNWIGQARRQGI